MEIKNFADVDNALKRVCELEVALADINGEITLKCNEIKDAQKAKVEKLDSEKNISKLKSPHFVKAIRRSLPKSAVRTLPSARSDTN